MNVVEFKIGGKRVPTEIEVQGKKISLTFPYFKPLVDQVKVMQGADWKPELKYWLVDNCNRNRFAFDKLVRGPRYSKYTTPLKHHDSGMGLWSHQEEMYDLIMNRHRCLIGAEPRTGKTLPSLLAFFNSDHSFCWFVTTNSASLGVELEIEKWFKDKISIWPNVKDNTKVVRLLTYNKFTSLANELPVGEKLPPFVIFDECHKLKSVTSNRTLAGILFSELLEDYYKGDEYIVGLSGTPAPLAVEDWWSQCEVVRAGFIREGNVKKFRGRYGEYLPWDGSTPVWERYQGPDKVEIAKLSQRLAGLVRVYFQADCMDLPPIQYVRVRLPPPRALLRVAKLITETSTSALEVRRRLRQLSDGFEYKNEYDEDTNKMKRVGTELVGSEKEEQLRKDLEEYEAVGRVIIYGAFQGTIDIISKICLDLGWNVLQIDGRKRVLLQPDKEPTSDHTIIKLALGEMDRSADTHTIDKLAFVANTDAGGSGIELSSSPVIIYYSNSDSGEGKMQSKRRAYSNNMDKERGLAIKDYILLPSDELILDKLDSKEEIQAISMGALVDLYKHL